MLTLVSAPQGGRLRAGDGGAPSLASRTAIFAVQVHNIDAIRSAFGAEAAVAVSDAVLESLEELFLDGSFAGAVFYRACGQYDLMIEENWIRGAAMHAAQAVERRLDRWMQDASVQVHAVGSARVLAVISLRRSAHFVSSQATRAELSRTHEDMARWSQRVAQAAPGDGVYAQEMSRAVSWVEELAEGRLALAWVPVRSLQDESEIAYCRGRLCAMSPAGAVLDPEPHRAAIARLGLSPVLDLAVLVRAAEVAATTSGPPLAVTLSASTLRASFWQIALLLDTLPADARERLRIVIVPDLAEGDPALFAAVADLRQRGVVLGVEMRGPDHLERDMMLSIRPEFIVAAPIFMRLLLARPGNREAIMTICALARLIAPMVVLQGIDTPLLAEHARRAGVYWGEGEYMGPASWQAPRAPRGC